jgi:hypothetical protein
MPARGQEMSDHYMAPPSTTSPVLACMRELQSKWVDDDESDHDDDDATYITCMNVAITYQHTNHINHLVITTDSISTSIFFYHNS